MSSVRHPEGTQASRARLKQGSSEDIHDRSAFLGHPLALFIPANCGACPRDTWTQVATAFVSRATAEDLLAVQRLRYEVFNLELEEGLESAHRLGRDEDRFDATCHHLLVESKKDQRVVGTYRLMHAGLAAERGGFYSQTEFSFRDLPSTIMTQGAELGRACVDAGHRNGRVLHLLWKGLARYLSFNRKRYLFGCCSVPTMDPAAGQMLARLLQERGRTHPTIRLRPLDALKCEADVGESTFEEVVIPPLMESYFNMGAQVYSEPALDRDFKVIDFFVVLDMQNLPASATKRYFERNDWR